MGRKVLLQCLGTERLKCIWPFCNRSFGSATASAEKNFICISCHRHLAVPSFTSKPIHLGQPVIKDTRPPWSRQRWGSQSRGGPCTWRAHLPLCALRDRRHSTLQGTWSPTYLRSRRAGLRQYIISHPATHSTWYSRSWLGWSSISDCAFNFLQSAHEYTRIMFWSLHGCSHGAKYATPHGF